MAHKRRHEIQEDEVVGFKYFKKVTRLLERLHEAGGERDRIRNRFNVSASEVDSLDRRQQATLGVALATNDRVFADQVLAKVVDLVRATPGASLVDYEVEIL